MRIIGIFSEGKEKKPIVSRLSKSFFRSGIESEIHDILLTDKNVLVMYSYFLFVLDFEDIEKDIFNENFENKNIALFLKCEKEPENIVKKLSNSNLDVFYIKDENIEEAVTYLVNKWK